MSRPPGSALPVPVPHTGPDDDLRGRRVLVTGARGFLGRHLVRRLLDAGAEVHALARPGTGPHPPAGYHAPRHVTDAAHSVRWHEGDLATSEDVDALVDAVDPDVVFHLASRVEGLRDPDVVGSMLDANTRSAVALMTAAQRRPGCRVVLAGSVEEPRGEDAPVSPYAAAKAAATAHARLFHAQWELEVTVLRIAMAYGPDQPDERKLVPHVITHLLAGETPPVSSGQRGIDWVHVDDVCDAFLAAATCSGAPGLVADIGSGQAVSIAETVATIADEVAALTGRRVAPGLGELRDRRHDPALIADPGPAAEHLGWTARTPLAAGLAATVRWYHDRTAGEPDQPQPVRA